jgi:hypothetical protein
VSAGRAERSKNMAASLERRIQSLEALEDAHGGGDEGCDRCVGLLVIVEDVITGQLHSAEWNGEEIAKEELQERETERECPRCGRRIDPDEEIEIQVGGSGDRYP